MGAAPLVLLLDGMVVPIAFLLLALVFDALALIWMAYQLWHDEWSVRLWLGLRRFAHASLAHLTRNH